MVEKINAGLYKYKGYTIRRLEDRQPGEYGYMRWQVTDSKGYVLLGLGLFKLLHDALDRITEIEGGS